MSSACAPYWDAFLERHQYTNNEIIFWKENIDFVKSKFSFLLFGHTCLSFLMPVQL